MTATAIWIITAALLAVLIVEIAAIATARNGETLTERLSIVTGVRPLRWWRPLLITAASALAAWLVLHLFA